MHLGSCSVAVRTPLPSLYGVAPDDGSWYDTVNETTLAPCMGDARSLHHMQVLQSISVWKWGEIIHVIIMQQSKYRNIALNNIHVCKYVHMASSILGKRPNNFQFCLLKKDFSKTCVSMQNLFTCIYRLSRIQIPTYFKINDISWKSMKNYKQVNH